MAINPKYLEISEYQEEGYRPLVDYGVWRVAVLNYIDELLPEKIGQMQRHDETDEVFVLLRGRCILFLGEGEQSVSHIHAQDLEPHKLYNVKKSAWHTHTLSRDASVLIIENRDTDISNSPQTELTQQQRQKLVDLTKKLWG